MPAKVRLAFTGQDRRRGERRHPGGRMHESKEAYQAHATGAEQHQRYLKYVVHLESEQDCQDGEIVWSRP